MAVKFVQKFETLRYWHAMGLPSPCDQSRMAGDINWWGQDLKEPCNSASQTIVRMGMSADMALPGRVVTGKVCKSKSTNGSLRCDVDCEMWTITSRSSLVHRDMSQDVFSGAWALPHERRAWALVEHRWHGRLIPPTQAQMQLVGRCVPAPLSCHTTDWGLRMLQGHSDSDSRLQTV